MQKLPKGAINATSARGRGKRTNLVPYNFSLFPAMENRDIIKQYNFMTMHESNGARVT